MFRIGVSSSLGLVIASLLSPGCVPQSAGCPVGFALTADGRCVAFPSGDAAALGDGAAPDAGTADAQLPPGIDAGTGADGCALTTFYRDADGDGHGDAAMQTFACGAAPSGYVTIGDDCDDASADRHPGRDELCDGVIDQDCDGVVDDSCACATGATETCGASATPPCQLGTRTCAAGAWGPCIGNHNPVTETCNGTDDDCNGSVDDGLPRVTWYADADMDTYGADASAMMSCAERVPAGAVTRGGDCDDMDGARSPGHTEECNGTDDDCDTMPDNGFMCVRGRTGIACPTACGTIGSSTCSASCTLGACLPPTEICNGQDEDCNGLADEGLRSVGSRTCLAAISGGVSCPPLSGSAARTGAVIVALGSSFGVLYTSGSPARFFFQRLGASGSASGAPLAVGGSISASAMGVSARFDGARVVVASGTNLFAFDPTTGALGWGPFTLATPGRTATTPPRIVAASATRVTVYGVQTAGATTFLHRYQVNVATDWTGMMSMPTIAGSADAASDLARVVGALANVWDAIVVGGREVVVYRSSTSNDLRMVSAASGDDVTFAPAGMVASATETPGAASVAIAVRDASQAVSATNPLGVAWQGAAGTGTYLVQFASTTVTTSRTPALGVAPVPLLRSHGAPELPIYAPLALVAAPSSTSYMNHGMFFVIAVDDDTTTTSANVGTLTVWEAATSGVTMGASRIVPITTGGGSWTHTGVSVASAGGLVRFAQDNGNGDVETRDLGCR